MRLKVFSMYSAASLFSARSEGSVRGTVNTATRFTVEEGSISSARREKGAMVRISMTRRPFMAAERNDLQPGICIGHRFIFIKIS